MTIEPQLIEQVIGIARQTGQAIMAIYQTDFKQYQKQDTSPVTEADVAAHNIIVNGLTVISNLPILSEESIPSTIDWQQRKYWQTYWLIDPLDGTKEFINKNGEFTVNIALIKNGKPVLGIVYCPAIDCLYYGADGSGAYKVDAKGISQKLRVSDEPKIDEPWKIVGSRRHGADALAVFTANFDKVDIVSMGSSLKFCLVAEGKAHLYPRLGLTCEWDTAAAQAVVENAGGQVLKSDLTPLMYGKKEDLLNPYFVVCGKLSDKWVDGYITSCQQ